MLTLTARNGTSEAPLRDLAPYLEAPMHVFVVSADLQWSAHLHGMVSADVQQGEMGCESHTMTTPPVEFASPVSAHTLPMSVIPKPVKPRCPHPAATSPAEAIPSTSVHRALSGTADPLMPSHMTLRWSRRSQARCPSRTELES